MIVYINLGIKKNTNKFGTAQSLNIKKIFPHKVVQYYFVYNMTSQISIKYRPYR